MRNQVKFFIFKVSKSISNKYHSIFVKDIFTRIIANSGIDEYIENLWYVCISSQWTMYCCTASQRSVFLTLPIWRLSDACRRGNAGNMKIKLNVTGCYHHNSKETRCCMLVKNSRRYVRENFSNKIRNNACLRVRTQILNSRTTVERGGFYYDEIVFFKLSVFEFNYKVWRETNT
jgi:hypothetical protein